MTEFKSERVDLGVPRSAVFEFLSDFTNFENLMPPQIKNWKADKDHCSFTIEGLADLSMRIASRTGQSNVHIVADGKNPIDYTLDCFLFEGGDARSGAELVFNADLNPFLKAMASRPLQNFVDMLAERLQQHFSA